MAGRGGIGEGFCGGVDGSGGMSVNAGGMRPSTKGGNKHGHHWIKDVRRLGIYLRDGLACAYCRVGVESQIRLTLDHIRPRSKGGTNNSVNLLTACIQCNAKRRDKSFTVFVRALGICPVKLRKSCRRKPRTAQAKELIQSRGTLTKAIYGEVSA